MRKQRATSRRGLIGTLSAFAFGSLLRAMPAAVREGGSDERATEDSQAGDFRSDLPSAASERFRDNGDGTVMDLAGGLMWQKLDGGPMTLEAAQEYARKLDLAGHSDWRLPLPMELFCIMDHRLHGPAMNTRWFPASEARYWWTEISRPDSPNKYWQVNTGGGIGAHAKSEAIGAGGESPVHTRCVRGPSPWKDGPKLMKNADGTVADQTTGLIWHSSVSSESMTWEAAERYCRNLQHAGQTDWRLPTVRELRSVSDDRMAQPSLNPEFFSKAGSVSCWSSTTQRNRPERAWFVDFTSGLVTYRDKTENMRVLVVRGTSPLTAEPTEPVAQNPRETRKDKSSKKNMREGENSRGKRPPKNGATRQNE